MRVISIREASKMMQMPEEFVRESIRRGKIPGAYYLKRDDKSRGSFFITDAQIENLMKGAVENEGVVC